MPLMQVPFVQSDAEAQGSPMRPADVVDGALQTDPVPPEAIGWQVVPAYALQSPLIVQPGKQTNWLFPFSMQ
jgi:hypothetical protein